MKHHTFAMGVAVAVCVAFTAGIAQAALIERGTGTFTSDGVEYTKKLIYDDLLDVTWLNFIRDFVVDFDDQGWQDQRTRQNVHDSDGTVIFSHGDLKGGSKRTGDSATELCKPWLHIDLNKTGSAECIGKPLPKAWKQRSSYGFCRSMDAPKSRTTCSAGHRRRRRSRVFWRKVVYRPET